MSTLATKRYELTAGRFMFGVVMFLLFTVVVDEIADEERRIVVPIVIAVAFIQSARKSPPIAIMILLYFSMIQGSWFILGAAPITMLLARRYQRQRLKLERNPVHIRRTVLLALVAMAATTPFIGASINAWSSGNQGRPRSVASPLVTRRRPGEEGLLQRLAGWLGFGPNSNRSSPFGSQGSNGNSVQPAPVTPPTPDNGFNWWIVAAVVAILALAILAWWLWRRGHQEPAAIFVSQVAAPLARLEAVGARIGRPRASHEGAIAYGQALAARTGDERLSEAGPLVSGQVYQSLSANPREVGTNLANLESMPPRVPPRPTSGQRFAAWRAQLPSTRALAYGLIGTIVIVVALWLVVPRLAELQPDRTESGLEQLQVVPLGTEHVDNF